MQRRLVSLGRSDKKLNLPCSVDVSMVSSHAVAFVLVFQGRVQSWGRSPLLIGMILNSYSLMLKLCSEDYIRT